MILATIYQLVKLYVFRYYIYYSIYIVIYFVVGFRYYSMFMFIIDRLYTITGCGINHLMYILLFDLMCVDVMVTVTIIPIVLWTPEAFPGPNLRCKCVRHKGNLVI